MTIDRYTPWAEGVLDESDDNGPKVETDETFTENVISNGFTAERLPYPRLNRLLNRADTSINNVIDAIPPHCPGDKRKQSTLMNSYFSSHVSPFDSGNRIALGISGGYPLYSYPVIINGVHKILAVIGNSSATVIVVDEETFTVDDTVDLSTGLGSGTWYAQGVLADEINAYFVFENGTTGYQFIQAYNMSDWSVASGWPATGTSFGKIAVPGGSPAVGMIHADDDFIAIASKYYNIADGTPTMLTLIDKSDGSIDDTGNGDSTSSGTLRIRSICSNGTYIFFFDGTQICSANISNLSVGCGGTNWPLTVSCVGGIGSMASAGDIIVIAGDGNTDPFCYVAHTENANIASITTNDHSIIRYLDGVCFDGINFWGIGRALIGSTTREMMYRLNIGRCINENSSTAQSISASLGIVDPFGCSIRKIVATNYIVKPVHNGRDIFFMARYDHTSDCLFRFPMTHFR